MPRIEPVSATTRDPLIRYSFREARKRVGMVPEAYAVSAHHRPTFIGQSLFELSLERAKQVDNHLKELANLKAASVVGCEFCLDIGSFIASGSGIAEQQLRDLPFHGESDAFSPLEKLVLDYAEAMSQTPQAVDDDLFAQLREHFDEAQMVELTAAIAWENFRARFNAATGVPAQGFSKDGVCALPAARAGAPKADGVVAA
jgi:AhpD family alkylhydroperoxidase